MRSMKLALVGAVALTSLGLASASRSANAQISVTIGAEPNCPYGYYDYAPYNCAPDGYYGPEWFNGGHFIGAGRWHHGGSDFHGQVNNHFDPQHGYKGAMPHHGDAPSHQGAAPSFHGNETHDGQGHVSPGGHDGGHR